jgi:ribosome-associated protein
MVMKKINFRRFAVMCARAMDAKKCEDIVIIDIGRISALADYMLIATVTSPPHARAAAEEVEQAATAEGVRLLHYDGEADSSWHVMDYGGVIVHCMRTEARQYYSLDTLWRDARHVSWLKK